MRRKLSLILGFAICVQGIIVAGCTSVAGGTHLPTGTPSLGLPRLGQHAPSTPTIPSTEQRLTLVARQALGNLVQQVDATYDAGTATFALTGTIGGTVPLTAAENSAAQQLVKQLCFRAQQALWTSQSMLREISVTILGPALDDYSNVITAAYGAAVVEVNTAKRLEWASLTADSAWAIYDHEWLRQSYVPTWR